MKVRFTMKDGAPVAELLDDAGKPTSTKIEYELPQGFTIEDVGQIKSGLSEARDAFKVVARKLRGYGFEVADDGTIKDGKDGSIDPAAARRALAYLKDKDLPSAELEKRWSEKMAELEAQSAAEKQAIQQRVVAMARRDVERDIVLAIAKAKGNVDLLLPYCMARVKIDESAEGATRYSFVDPANGKVITTKKPNSAEPMLADEFVPSLKAAANMAMAFEGSGVGGSGATHATGGSGRSAPPQPQERTLSVHSSDVDLANYHREHTKIS